MRNKQILAVWGSPGSGKTLTAAKLASMLSQNRKDVILLFCDTFVPVMPSILPFFDMGDKSLGSIISSSDITQERIFSNCLTMKKNSYLKVYTG